MDKCPEAGTDEIWSCAPGRAESSMHAADCDANEWDRDPERFRGVAPMLWSEPRPSRPSGYRQCRARAGSRRSERAQRRVPRIVHFSRSEPESMPSPRAESSPPAPDARRWAPWLALLAIVAGMVWLYLPVLHTGFFADDYLFLDQVRDRSLLEALRAPDPLSNFFRPVSRQLYFWIVAGSTHESPFAFHAGNLVTLIAVVVLLWALVRRLSGERAAAFAAAFLALHYAADIPVRWACGSQELMAVAGALGAILLHLQGRHRWAGVAMLAAAFSKEVVLLAPVIAVVADHREGERWAHTARRAWPLALAVAIWGAVSLAMPHTHKTQATEVEFDLVSSPLAALAHLLQVIAGLEWLPGGFPPKPAATAPWLPLGIAASALWLVWNGGVSRETRGTRRVAGTGNALSAGLVWIAVATAPVVAVALLWSAYYYLFAICGVALVLGTLLARAPAPAALLVLAASAWGSAHARALPEFGIGRDAWTPLSHINAAYIERSNLVTSRYLSALQRAYPTLPHGSTLFFVGLQSNVAFQRGDGPLMRWAYRDQSLKAYYLNMFSHETFREGPVFFFVGSGDTLVEMEGGDDLYLRLALGMLVSDQVNNANDALEVAVRKHPGDLRGSYWHAWACWAQGDTATARRRLAAAGYPAGATSAGARDAAIARLAQRDTAGAISIALHEVRANPLDPSAHGLAADLLLIRERKSPEAAIEAFAARALAPGDPYAWRRWAMIQLDRNRPLQAIASFERYFDLGGAEAAADTEAHGYVDATRASIPRGAFATE